MSGTEIRRGWARGVVYLLAAALFALGQSLVWGPEVLWAIPPAIFFVILLFLVVYTIRDRALANSAPSDSRFTISAALYIDGVETSRELKKILEGANIKRAGLLGRGTATGFIDVLEGGLRWRPGSVSKKWMFKEFMIPWQRVENFSIAAMYPGLGRLTATLVVDLTDDSRAEFWTRNAGRFREELNKVYRVELSTSR